MERKKKKPTSIPTSHHIKYGFKLDHRLTHKSENYKTKRKHRGVGKGFLDRMQKVISIKEKLDKLDFIQI